MFSYPKTVNILGATGSIGQSAADVILSAPGRFDVQTVTALGSAEKLAETAVKLKAKTAVIVNPEKRDVLKSKLEGTGIEALSGQDKLESEAVDITLVAIVGIAGLRPAINAIENSRVVAIANKEPLVAAGPLVIETARKHGTILLPVDSEHNAIFQVYDSDRPQGIEKIILTASGGPFRTWSAEEMKAATVEQALAHPNWSMGHKISIDSATMMNKALEVIEAHYLFDIEPEKIEILVHPQSIVHSMVEYIDGSILAQMGASDMKTPIAHALAWPKRMSTPGNKLDLSGLKRLDFEKPDFERFPALGLSYDCLKAGQYACVALNAANEIAVDYFLTNHMLFSGIMNCVKHVLDKTQAQKVSTIEDIEELDMKIRSIAQDYMVNRDNGTIEKMAIS